MDRKKLIKANKVHFWWHYRVQDTQENGHICIHLYLNFLFAVQYCYRDKLPKTARDLEKRRSFLFFTSLFLSVFLVSLNIRSKRFTCLSMIWFYVLDLLSAHPVIINRVIKYLNYAQVDNVHSFQSFSSLWLPSSSDKGCGNIEIIFLTNRDTWSVDITKQRLTAHAIYP